MDYSLKRLQIVLVVLTFYWLLLAFLFYQRGISETVQWCIGIAVVLVVGSFLVLVYRKHAHRDTL